jgi:hypothetical protein
MDDADRKILEFGITYRRDARTTVVLVHSAGNLGRIVAYALLRAAFTLV